jgi:molecular chaperone DnaK
MVRDAEAHAEDDRARRETIEARNEADVLAYQVERTVSENRDRLRAVDVEEVERAVAAVRGATATDDAAAMRRAADDLQGVSHRLAERLYANGAAGTPSGTASGPGGPGATPDSDVIDAEVVEK